MKKYKEQNLKLNRYLCFIGDWMNKKKNPPKALNLMALFVNDTKLWKKKLHKSSSNFFRQTDKTEKEAVFLDTSYEVITLTSKSEKDTPQQKYSSLFLRNMNTEILSKILAKWSLQHIKWSVYYDQVWSIHECRNVSIYEALVWLSEKKRNW